MARAAPADEDLALLADLLSLPASQRHPLPNLSPQHKKERTLEALLRQLEGLARQQPVLVIFEDAHWIDPTSRELLDLTVERVSNLPVLLMLTFRPELHPPWTGQPQVTMLALSRLDRRERIVLVEQIAGSKALPDELVAQIADRTDGVPLFVEELTKSVLESGAPLVGIPATLHDSLMARLDRLASVRLVAQVGAAIGREFPYTLLRTVSRIPEDELRSALGRLVASELVFQRGTPPDAVYAFKHVLIQDAAHGSLLRSSRQQLHAQIAAALEAHSPETVENQPELLAQHYAEAGLVEKSVAYWDKAGRRSAARSAMAEAAAQFKKGLDQLTLLPDTRERQRQELEFLSHLGAALRFVKGQAAPETGQAFARAVKLWEQLGSPSEFLHVPHGQSRYHMYRGEFDLALRLDHDLLRVSRHRGDSTGLVVGHLASGRTLMLIGKFALSRLHLGKVTELYDPVSHRSLVHQIGYYADAISHAFLGIVCYCLGFPDQALAQSDAAIVEARRLAHPTTLASSLVCAIELLSLVEDNAALAERTNEFTEVVNAQGFAALGVRATIFRGWAKAQTGDVAEGISLLRGGLSDFRTTGTEVFMPHYIALLARACEISGEAGEASALLDEASQIVERTGERCLAAELCRHKGELLLRQGHLEEAEELHRKALIIAREQEAKMWELRAAASLARLCRDQGRRAEARDLLTPVYGWFTEGFDTPDLKEAKALLAELT
jgi:predicted ATPase